MANMGQKEQFRARATLVVGSFLLVSLLCFPSRSQADIVHFLKITFDGTGTYDYYTTSSDGFYSKDAMSFNWHTVAETAFSENQASNPETWGSLGFGSEPVVSVNGVLNYEGTDYNGFHKCAVNVVEAHWPSVSVMKALGSGFMFHVAPFGYFFYPANSCVLDIGPFWDGKELMSSFALPSDALSKGKIIQYVSGSRPMSEFCDDCSGSLRWNGTVTFEQSAEYTVPPTPEDPSNPYPGCGYSFSYDPVSTPSIDLNPAMAQPIGLGPAAEGGNTLDVNVAFSYPAPVDLYLALYAPSISPEIWLIGPGPSAQPFTQGLLRWKKRVSGPVIETVFANIPLEALPSGPYTFYLVATPPDSIACFYMWSTTFTNQR